MGEAGCWGSGVVTSLGGVRETNINPVACNVSLSLGVMGLDAICLICRSFVRKSTSDTLSSLVLLVLALIEVSSTTTVTCHCG